MILHRLRRHGLPGPMLGVIALSVAVAAFGSAAFATWLDQGWLATMGAAALLAASALIAIALSGARTLHPMLARLRTHEQQLRSMVSLSSDWYWERDADDRLVSVSAGFEAVTGLDPALFLGNTRGQLDGVQYGDNVDACRDRIARRQPFRDLEMQVRGRDGAIVYCLVSGEPIFNDEGVFGGYRGIGRNITAFKDAEQAHQYAQTLHELVKQREQAELALQRVMLQQQAILDNAAVGIAFTRNRMFEICNREMEIMMGFAPGTMVGRPTVSVYPSHDAFNALSQRAIPILSRGDLLDAEVELQRQDGSLFLSRMRARAVDPRDQSMGSIFIIEDVTERKAAEEKLAQTLLEQSTILENAVIGIAIISSRTIVRCNAGMESLLGYGPGELNGASTRCWYDSDEQYEEMGALIAQFASGGTLYSTDMQLVRKDGSKAWFSFNAKAGDPGHALRGGVCVIQDITARKHAEQQLQQTNRALELAMEDLRQAQSHLVQSEKMAALGQLVAGVAHEINTPIGSVKSSGKNIADSLDHALENMPRLFGLLDGDEVALFMRLIGHHNEQEAMLSTREERAIARELTVLLEQAGVQQARQRASILVQLRAHADALDYLPLLRHPQCELVLETAYSIVTIATNTTNINVAVDRVAKIVFALKSFSRVDLEGELVEADVRDGVETVLTIYQNQIKQNTELIRHYDPIAPLRCLPDELNQVWTNLIHNALQAMDYRGTLTIGIRRQDDEAVVSIGDTGPGIDPAIRDRIFDAFFTTKPAGEGSGLGLDIVRKIINKHHGRIGLDSVVGVGTTFHVYLPYNLETT